MENNSNWVNIGEVSFILRWQETLTEIWRNGRNNDIIKNSNVELWNKIRKYKHKR